MTNKVYIFDLDGTISLCDHRLKYIQGKKKDWDTFFKACINDKPNKPVIQILNELSVNNYTIIIVSGRSADVRKETEKWLQEHIVLYDYLYMRPHNNFTSDDILKKELMLQAQKEMNFTKEDVLCIFEDRSKVVKMWRDLGYTCFQVKDGDY